MDVKGETLPTPTTAARLAEGVALIRAIRPAGEGVGGHTHDYHSITVLLSNPGSSLWCYGDGKSRSVRPTAGEVFFCPAHVTTVVRCEKAFESILLCLSPTILSRVADDSGGVALGDTAPAIMQKDSFIQRVVTSLADEVGREKRAGVNCSPHHSQPPTHRRGCRASTGFRVTLKGRQPTEPLSLRRCHRVQGLPTN